MDSNTLEAWFNEVWGNGNLALIDSIFAPDAQANGLMSNAAVGPKDFHDLVPAMLRLVRNVDVKLEQHLTAGDWMSVLLRFTGLSARDGRPVDFTAQVMGRMTESGQFTEVHNNVDFISLFEQLGHLPQDTLALCLTGEVLQ